METLDELMGQFADTKPATAIEGAFEHEGMQEQKEFQSASVLRELEKSELKSTKKISLNYALD